MCELALGLGMTVGRLRQEMTQDELGLWVAYVDENGPLNPSLRVEAAIARIGSPFFKNSKPRDFMPWPKEPERNASPDELAMMFKTLATKTKARKH